jgi:hypothetical protein
MEGAMRNDPENGSQKPAKVTRAQVRESRLKAALKANMARRKAQVRARTGEEAASETGPGNEKD